MARFAGWLRRRAQAPGLASAGVLLGFLVLALPAMADFSQRQKITSTPRGVGAQFGDAVALDGNTMVVGARYDGTTASQAGAAFVYVRSGTTWTQQAVLLASDGAVADKFGYSVAISGNTIVVGAFNDDSPLSNAGSAYVFVRSGTTWTQQQKLTASDAAADQEFGNAVAVIGDTIAVGEHFADLPSNSEAGAVYIFRRTGTVWAQTQKLIPVGGVILGDHFGEAVAVSGDKLVVGAAGADIPETGAGSVYVFVDTGGSYIQQDKLSIAGGKNGDSFGFSVAISGTTLVGGALQYTPLVAQPAYGAAYVFEFNGSVWVSQGRLTASDGAAFDRFGYSVAVNGDTVVVGAREADTAVGGDAGAAYVFTRAGAAWTQRQKLVPADPFNGDRFGVSVAMDSATLVVGAAEKNLTSPNGQGAAYVFKSGAHPVFPDFDGDGRADLSLFRPSTGFWYVYRSSDSMVAAAGWGLGTDLLAPADYDGDGKTDLAVYRAGTWYVNWSSTSQLVSTQWGTTGDLPMPGDFDGDGKADLTIFRPSTGQWFRSNSSNGQAVVVTFGAPGDIPLSGDFDGDGLADLAYYRPADGSWHILRSSNSTLTTSIFGISTDIPVPADYDGDGKTDIAVYRPSTGVWYILSSATLTFSSVPFGVAGDWPVPADYDGDGKADIGVFRPSTGTWFLLGSTAGLTVTSFGTSSDLPVPFCFTLQALFPPAGGPQPGADFNGDGKSDLVWQNTTTGERYVWLMSGTTFTSSVSLGVVSTPWQIAGTGDFNGDGKPDLVWQNTATGDRYVWLMNGTTFTSSVYLGNLGTQWQIAGTGDFNGDGKTDLVWQNTATGERYVWLMNGTTFTSSVSLGVISVDWQIAGTGDFDGDGKADLIWQNTVTGERYVWLMNGTTYSSSVFLGLMPTAWQIRN